MADERITISRDELYTPEVDARLKQQEARARVAEHYGRPDDLDQVALPAKPRRGPFWYNPILYTAFFGLLGGLLAWGVGELVIRTVMMTPLERDAREADRFFAEGLVVSREENKLFERFKRGQLNQDQLREALGNLYRAHADSPVGKLALEEHELILQFEQRKLNEGQLRAAQDKLKDKLRQAYARNRILTIELNHSLKGEEKDRLIKGLLEKEKPRLLIGEMVFLGQLGLLLACFLALADPVVGRNWRAAVINGSVGILLGMLGGILVALFISKVYQWLGGGRLDRSLVEQMVARTLAWGVLGLFLAIAPGVVLRSGKRLMIGLVGGLLGGLLGGLAFDPLTEAARSDVPARGVGLAAIGLLTGAATGLIEQAAKRGWLHVAAGLIAGKQFILYRNPTFIGSSPRCEIYLFKDPDVSPRHAAIHRVRGGFELEDLDSATGTRVNGRPVKRVRLRNGDQVQIGSTGFIFRERARTAVDDRGPTRIDPAPAREPEELRPVVQGSDQIWEKKSP
jgi:hypothetical protein